MRGEAGGLSGAPLKPLALDALRTFRSAERRRNPADRRRRDRQRRRRLGSGSAPGRASSSSTRRWSMRAPASPGASPTGSRSGSSSAGCRALPTRWEAASPTPCVPLWPCSPHCRSPPAPRSLPPPAPSRQRPRDGQRRRSARGRGGSDDPAPGRKRDRRGARDLARADRGRAAKLGHRRRRLPRLRATRAALSATYDGRETAPAAARPDWFFKDGQPMTGRQAVPGGKSVGVPGNIRLMALAHRDAWQARRGRALFEPAIRARARRFRDHPAPARDARPLRARPRALDAPRRRALFYRRRRRAARRRHARPQPARSPPSSSSSRRAARTASTSAPTPRRSPRRSAARRATRRR